MSGLLRRMRAAIIPQLVALAAAHTFTSKQGYLPAGHNVASLPPGPASLADAEAKCAAEKACVGFTFEGTHASPTSVISKVFFKTTAAPISPDGQWQTYLKDGAKDHVPPRTPGAAPQAHMPVDPQWGMRPDLEQDFTLPVLATLSWVLVFQIFLGGQAMTCAMTKASRFSYEGNPRWETGPHSVHSHTACTFHAVHC